KELLEKFKDREEWGVRVFADLKKFRASIAQFNPETKEKRGSGTAYLLRKKQEEGVEKAVHEKLAFFSEEILDSLKELAFGYKVTKSSQRFSEKGEILISVFAFLLPKSKIRKFNQKLESLQKKYQKFGLSLTSSGPWPAYNFVS
ncbi:MAG: GvpL/GvpF family gas vesicle protein, partial [candidate division Zixibacteria bacterium]|nr:GvpL/GvpF family gas vesicle protein [candidate division Zixibacteria bacterium]